MIQSWTEHSRLRHSSDDSEWIWFTAHTLHTNVNSNMRVRACAYKCVCECTNLVATASSGKWRLLNTRAKAPSWEEKDLEKRQTLPSSDKSPAPEPTTEGDYQARKQKPVWDIQIKSSRECKVCVPGRYGTLQKWTLPEQKQSFCLAGALWTFFFCVCVLDVWVRVGEQWGGIGSRERPRLYNVSWCFESTGWLHGWLRWLEQNRLCVCVCLCVVCRAGGWGVVGGIAIWFLLVQILKAHVCLPCPWDESPLQPKEQRSDVQKSSWKREARGAALPRPAVTSVLLGWLLQKRLCDVYRSLTGRMFVRLQTYGNHVHDTFDDVALLTFKTMEIYFTRTKQVEGNFSPPPKLL